MNNYANLPEEGEHANGPYWVRVGGRVPVKEEVK